MLNWHNYSKEEKDRYFTNFYCHELNLFIYKKDKTYFDKTVRPFIKCKMEKDLVDHYLLGNEAEVLKSCAKDLSKGLKLNALEQCLLIDVASSS